MAIGGIGGYNYGMSNSYTQNDLYAIMKRADEVRSPAYRKKIQDFVSGKTSSIDGDSSTSSGEIGTVSAELNLSGKSADLSKAASALMSISKADMEDGDTLVKKVNSFIEAYNGTVEAMSKSDSVDALREGVNMTNATKMYSNSLKRIGITIGSDNKLKLNESTLKSADKNVVKSMLTNSYSAVSRINDKAERITKAAKNKAQTTAFRNQMYGTGSTASNKGLFGTTGLGGYGSYSYLNSGTGSMFNLLI